MLRRDSNSEPQDVIFKTQVVTWTNNFFPKINMFWLKNEPFNFKFVNQVNNKTS